MSLMAKRGPRSVSVLLWDGTRVLLVRRGVGGLFPHTWTLPGGEVHPGETSEAAAMRIAEEGLGIGTSHVRRLRKLPQPSHFRDARGPDTVVQIVTWSGDETAGPAEAAWFAPEALDALRIFREARDLLRGLCATLPRAEPTPVGKP